MEAIREPPNSPRKAFLKAVLRMPAGEVAEFLAGTENAFLVVFHGAKACGIDHEA